MSFRRKQIVPLAQQGVVRIEGINKDEPAADSNMAGKSSIMEALIWCLFGRTIRGLKHDAVVHRFSRHNCSVTTLFRCDGVHYTLRRYRKHRRHQNRLQLWRADRLLSYRHEAQTQAKLESILGCDYQSFTNTAIFGGSKPFALLTDAEQKKVLESFLGFQKFEAALHLTRDQRVEAERKHHALQIKIEQERGSVRTLQGKLKTLRRSEAIFGERAREEAREARRELERLREPPPGPSPKVLAEAGEAVETLATKSAKASWKAQQFRQRLKKLKSSIRNKESLIGKPCPVCGQAISARTVKALLRHLGSDRRAARKHLRSVKVHASKFERRLAYAREYLKRVTKQHHSCLLLQAAYHRERRDLELCSTIRHDPPNPFVIDLERLSIRYSRHLSRLLLYQFEEHSLTGHIRDLKFWETGFGNRGVKALVVREALPTLNVKLSEYAQEIFQGSARLRFSPSKTTKQGEERELFHLRYQARHGSASYLGESAGGRRRVDICVLLVFSWLSRTCNVLLVDELLDGLDESGREAILSILSRLRGTVLVISHEKQLKAHMGRTWTVTKKNDASVLELNHAT